MSQSSADEYIQNNGPYTSVFRLLDLITCVCYQSNIQANNNNQQRLSNDSQHLQQIDDDSTSVTNESLFTSNFISS